MTCIFYYLSPGVKIIRMGGGGIVEDTLLTAVGLPPGGQDVKGGGASQNWDFSME